MGTPITQSNNETVPVKYNQPSNGRDERTIARTTHQDDFYPLHDGVGKRPQGAEEDEVDAEKGEQESCLDGAVRHQPCQNRRGVTGDRAKGTGAGKARVSE